MPLSSVWKLIYTISICALFRLSAAVVSADNVTDSAVLGTPLESSSDSPLRLPLALPPVTNISDPASRRILGQKDDLGSWQVVHCSPRISTLR